MADSSIQENPVLESSFRFLEFQNTVFGVDVGFYVIKMDQSYFVWIGSQKERVMADLSTAMITRFQPMPLSSNLLGSNADNSSTNLATKLSKKLKTPVLLSYNLKDQKMLLEVEKILWEEIKERQDFFT